jgi:hypothetical protein
MSVSIAAAFGFQVVSLYAIWVTFGAWMTFGFYAAGGLTVVVRKNSIRAIGAEYEHESRGMMSA